ncbi:MAG: molybdenum cofactor guanylyltransferase MobA [Gammaproteobacteria bacterium]
MDQASNGITCVILAGGKSYRFGGNDKGLETLAGRAMVEYVIDAIAPQVDEIVINANRNIELYAGYGFPVIQDSFDYAGPLAGMAAGIEAATTNLVLTVPCDGPRLPSELVSRLKHGLEQNSAMVSVAHDGERMQPVFALFRREILPEIYSYLQAGGRKLQLWLSQQKLAIADFSDQPDAFINVNTPEDRELIEDRLMQE